MNRLTKIFLTVVLILTVGTVCYALNNNAEGAVASESHSCSYTCSHSHSDAGNNLECPKCKNAKLTWSAKAFSEQVNCYLCKGTGKIGKDKCTVKDCVNGKVTKYTDGWVCTNSSCDYKCRKLPD